MGWWSATIMGGDTPQDLWIDITEFVGVSEDTLDSDEVEGNVANVPGIIDLVKAKSVDEWVNFIKNHEYGEPEITAQAVAVFIMQVGAPLPKEVADLAIDASENEDLDEWGSSAEERKGYLNAFVATIKAYDGTPTELPYEGLFDKIFESLEKAEADGVEPGLVNKGPLT